eukprot:gene9306-12538_t
MESIKPSNESQETMYQVSDLRKPQHIADLGRECLSMYHVFGMDSTRRGNLNLIEKNKLIYVASNAVVIEDFETGSKDYLIGIDEGGVGCVTIHPSKKIFAVGGKGFQPKIYVYSYPEMKILKILRGGAEKGYAFLTFDAIGDTLASVSTSPDFMLTIWEWREEKMGLHAKAFGQDVTNVRFSLDDPRRLTTSGVGHIRFWKMAATFTGLKLQGSIGKFGKIDLSDIDNFVELPDGKVISGTETGSLLLWEGNFIKCRFVQVGGNSCHSGNITYVEYDRTEKCIITAAVDGYIRWWDFSAIDSAEVDSDHSMDFQILPVAEYFIGQTTSVGIKAMIDSGYVDNTRYFVILDTGGQMQTVTFTRYLDEADRARDMKRVNLVESVLKYTEQQQKLKKGEVGEAPVLGSENEFYVEQRVISSFHSSAITGLDTCPIDYLAATCSTDGSVRCVNYIKRKEIANRQFSTAATCLKWLPISLDQTSKMIFVGFADGVVRVMGLGIGNDGKMTYLRKMVYKPHNAAVYDVAFSEDGKWLATCGKDGIIFFFQCVPIIESKLHPVEWKARRFVTIAPGLSVGKSLVYCERLSWSPNNSSILCTCNDGILRSVDLNDLLEESQYKMIDKSDELVSYEAFFPIVEVSQKIYMISSANKTNMVGSSSLSLLPPMTDKLVTSEEGKENEGAPSPTKQSKNDDSKANEITSQLVPVKINTAIYSLNRLTSGILTSATLSQRNFFFESEPTNEVPTRDLPVGLYSADGNKDSSFLKNPSVTCLRYSWSHNFLLVGTQDGSVILRSSTYLETFARTIAHNSACDGVGYMSCSFDDKYILSVGKDSQLVIHRVRLDIVNEGSISLYKDLEANIFGTEIIKPIPINKSGISDYQYLSYYSDKHENVEENKLFDSVLSKKKEDDVLSKPLLNPHDETTDVQPGAYSIQDNRLKMEENAKKDAAEILKDRVRLTVRALQKDYENIINENNEIPQDARLSPEEMLIDKEYFYYLTKIGQEMVDEVHNECAYDAEKAEKLRLKVEERLTDGLLIEEMTLSAFPIDEKNSINKLSQRQPVSMVRSLRCRRLDKKVMSILTEVSLLIRESEIKDAQNKSNEIAHKKALEAVDHMKQKLMNTSKNPEDGTLNDGLLFDTTSLGNNANKGEDDQHNESSLAVRRLKRKERKEELAKHSSEKPKEDEDDIRDLNAIKIAEKTIGDYRLKCADDYEVPADQRINAPKKLRQMALLEEAALNIRLQFNDRFLALRSLKRELIFSIRRNNKTIREIDHELQQTQLSQDLWEPSFDPEEFSDDMDEITPDELNEYMAAREKASWELVKPPKHSVITGNKLEIVRNSKTNSLEVANRKRDDFKIDINTIERELPVADPKLIQFTPPNSEGKKYYEVDDNILTSINHDPSGLAPETKRLQHLENVIPSLFFVKSALKNRSLSISDSKVNSQNNNSSINKLKILLLNERRKRLEFQRMMILKKQTENLEAFRDAINDLRVERHAITADLKLAELKLVTLYQEYKLLLTFEGRDNALQQKQIRCKGEESEIIANASDNKMKLEVKLDELQNWTDKLNAISQEFKSIVPDNNTYVDQLTKIFKKKVKRSKVGGDNEDDEDEYEEEEEEEDDNDDDDDNGDEVEDICPPGCDISLYERVLDLREKKLDTDEVTSEITKSIDELKKLIDRLKSREKQIIKEGQQTEVEVQQFQLQKQAALNQISVVIPVRISQLFMFETSGALSGPTDQLVTTSVTANNNNNGIKNLLSLSNSKDSDNNSTLIESDSVQALKDSNRRLLIEQVDLRTHTLFSK